MEGGERSKEREGKVQSERLETEVDIERISGEYGGRVRRAQQIEGKSGSK